MTSPKIAHRIPDFVVSAYPQTGNSPWKEIGSITSAIGKSMKPHLSGGSIAGVTTDFTHQDSLQFNEVDIIGNPIIELNKYSKFLCRSEARPLTPYFLSSLDSVSWRSGLPDALRYEAFTPGEREIGEWPSFTWGSVYPRSGFVQQQHPGKAAAVVSQRAIDILLNDGKGHIRLKELTSGKTQVVRGNVKAKSPNLCRKSGGRWEIYPKLNDQGKCVKQTWQQWHSNANEQTDRWQMLLPNSSQQCEIFARSKQWPYDASSQNGAYVWNYWRQYKCCIKAGQVLLNDFDFD